MSTFQQELTELINRRSMENGSGTPDFILAQYLVRCLNAYNRTLVTREEWYGRKVGVHEKEVTE